MTTDYVGCCADRVIAEIRADIAAGLVPATVASFAELHDYVDANTYSGLTDPADANIITDAVDRRIKAGELRD